MPVENLPVDAVTANRDTSLQELAIAMDDEGVGDIVITETDEPVGVVTDRDIALAVAKHGDPSDLTADHLVDGDVATIEAGAEAVAVSDALVEGRSDGSPSSTGTAR